MGELAPTLYTIGEVAAILGVSPHTIRAWERRHGMVQPTRTAARQRRYRGEDLELLRNVKRAMDIEGMSLKVAYKAATGALQPAEQTSFRRRLQTAQYATLPEGASLWHAVSDVLPELIVILGSDGRIVDSNVAVARTFGTVRQRLVGRDFLDLVHRSDRPKAALLFQPAFCTVSSWELNMATPEGPLLYSFQTWQVRQGNRSVLAAVGSEMYPGSVPEVRRGGSLGLPERRGATLPERGHENPTVSVLKHLIDRLPFGIAVVTVGPEPRVVYGNNRLLETLGLPPGSVTGRRLSELLPLASVERPMREAVEMRMPRRVNGVHRPSDADARLPGRSFNITFRPLYSSQLRITSILVVLEHAVTKTASGRQLVDRP